MTRYLSAAEISQRIDDGAFRSSECDSYWIDDDELGRIGFFRFEDLQDDTPVFDLRLATDFRGRGLGLKTLQAATDHLFTTTEFTRFEGQTRDDNIAMRSIFVRAGWVKEAHYRGGWPVTGEISRDSVAYAILKEEWQSGTSTGLQWSDLPLFSPEETNHITYTSNHLPTREELRGLYSAVGWSRYTDDPQSLFRAVQSSSHIVTARDKDSLIGLARVLSDGVSIAYVQDVLVHPDLQRRGVGRELMKRVLAPLSAIRQQVLLTDDGPEQRAFYESLGFSAAADGGRWPVGAFVRLSD